MRFLIGVVIGFAAGLAGAILFAPETRRSNWPEGHPARSLNGDQSGGIRGALRTLQDHVNEAWEEARVAAEESEKQMASRYQDARASAAADAERDTQAIYADGGGEKKAAKRTAKKAREATKTGLAGKK